MRRVALPALRRKALETLTHTGLSTLHSLGRRPDAALVFNAANAPYIAALRACGVPTALHIDGHDARRAKWAGFGAKYYRAATKWGSSIADAVVVDSIAVQEELRLELGVRSHFIAYGAPDRSVAAGDVARNLSRVGLAPGGYHLLVARFEPENQVLEIVEGFRSSSARLPLVVVGFAGYPGDYARLIVETAERDNRVRLMGAVWDQELLDAMYAGAATYLHGHSVGGTNPSLLRAMGASTPVIAFDCAYNRETTGGAAMFFGTAADLADQVKMAEFDPGAAASLAARARQRVRAHYRWSDVTDGYESLIREMVATRSRARLAPRATTSTTR